MKKYILLILFAIGFYIFMDNLPDKNDLENPSKESSGGYYSTMVDVKNNAKENITKAIEEETNKLNEAIMESLDLGLVEKYSKAVIKTSVGNIEVEFFNDKSPMTVNNFLKLSSEGFYDQTAFHRVIQGFMIQGGDPLSKKESWNGVPVGTGDPGYKFEDEFNSEKLVRGSLAMANSGPNTNGSQFFIVTADSTPWLDGKHTNFGQVISGMDIIEKIENSNTNQMDQPLEKIIINSIELLEK